MFKNDKHIQLGWALELGTPTLTFVFCETLSDYLINLFKNIMYI